MSDAQMNVPPGWYPEQGSGLMRYWDGHAWGAYAPVAGANSSAAQRAPKEKVVAGILGILLGGLGIHKFYLGYTSPGLIMLLGSAFGWVFSCFLIPLVLPVAFGVIGLVEGIVYLTRSDEEFQATYVARTKEWF